MILLKTSHSDITTNKVCAWLYHCKIPFLRINENSNAFEEIKISNKEINIIIKYEGKEFDLKDFKIIWNRRGFFDTSIPNIDLININKVEVKTKVYNHLTEEKKTLQNFAYHNLTKVFHINDPRHYNANKLITLQTAVECGLKIPETSIVKNLEEINTKKDSLITKNIQDVLSYFDKEVTFGHSTKKIEDFQNNEGDFFYSLFQEEIKKKYEIRSFVFLDKVFSMAIFSQNNEQTSTDFRNYDREKPNRNIPFNLPKIIEQKLLKLMKKMKLESGSVDFIYDGTDFIFLEINPVGQLDFVSVSCNYHIEKYIAEELTKKYEELNFN